MRLKLVGCAALLCGLFPFAIAQDNRPAWQIHSTWCASDNGSSGRAYSNVCEQGSDQFDSVLACQRDAHNDGAVAAVSAAGRQAVNDYMADKKGATCKK
jgi:hypothetical protein